MDDDHKNLLKYIPHLIDDISKLKSTINDLESHIKNQSLKIQELQISTASRDRKYNDLMLKHKKLSLEHKNCTNTLSNMKIFNKVQLNKSDRSDTVIFYEEILWELGIKFNFDPSLFLKLSTKADSKSEFAVKNIVKTIKDNYDGKLEGLS